MMLNKEAAYLKIEELVQRFEEQLPSYKKADYNETLTRKDFIDPFFKALGWDMDNSQGNAEAYREVIHEDKVKVGAATKAPDYSFKLAGGKRLFFVEAKKPSVVVKDEVLPAYQVRRYAWSAKLPISILTDFEEFAIYDCNKKPNATDKPSVGRIKYLTFREYLKEFDFIWNTFSKERVLKGSFDQFIAADKHKKGTATVDKEFLISLDEWRKQLALNIALRNETLTEDELNFVVQQTLDRLIFLRIAEDRGVEEYGRLKALLSSPSGGGQEGAFYNNLFTYFKEADSKYNSGLFDFKKDSISRKIVIDNKTIKGIINELYYPISPYEFSVLSVEILGSAYEQFLGKQIKLSAGHRATIEEKSEVRKAGGVYYTPQYIVEYIVENTIGRIIHDLSKKSESSKASPPTGGVGLAGAVSKLKIVDPACGSGSFLLGAYQYLLNWHLQYYKPEFEKLTAIAQNSKEYNEKQRNDALKERNKLPLTPTGNLTTALKKQILLNNIYGVDIDTQAVEVTKLSLLLKCMEGETGSSISAEMRFGERILPTLDSNIKSGNSLIDVDFFDGQIDYGDEKKIKPFNWQRAFPEVFKVQKVSVSKELKWHNKKVFDQAGEQEEKAKELIRNMGGNINEPQVDYGKVSGFDIVIGNPPYVMLQNLETREVFDYALKKFQSAKYKIDTYQLFIETSVKLLAPNGLLAFITPNTFLKNIHSEPLRKFMLDNVTIKEFVLFNYPVFNAASVDTCVFIIENSTANKKSTITIKQADAVFLPYISGLINQVNLIKNNRTDFNLSISEGDSELLNSLKEISDPLGGYCKAYFGIQTHDRDKYVSRTKLNKDYRPVIDGANIHTYFLKESSEFVNYIPEAIKSGGSEFVYSKERICIRQIGAVPVATIVSPYIFTLNTIYNVYLKDEVNIDLKFVLGLINSKVIRFFWSKMNSDEKKTFPKIKKEAILSIPIKKVKTQSEQSLHDEIVQMVETMLQLQQQKQSSTLPGQLQQLEQRIAYTDDKINEKVYTLYGLSEEEVKVVEGR
jgi:type I restriction-modification system DNA methylase subunit/predicted type IV restriction endonuclease